MRGARLVVLALAVLAAMAADPPANCIYEDPAGSGLVVDLSPLATKNWGPINMGSSYSILLKPCGTLVYDPLYMPEGNGVCAADAVACQLLNDAPANLVGNVVNGVSNFVDNTTVVDVTGGTHCPAFNKNRRARITLSCGTSEGTPVYVTEDQCEYQLTWSTIHACPKMPSDGGGGGGSGGLSGGDVFLIIFFVGGFLYVAVGYAYMYKFKEARGVEAVPNVEFWRSLPGLCKDGAVFTWQKITGLCSRS